MSTMLKKNSALCVVCLYECAVDSYAVYCCVLPFALLFCYIDTFNIAALFTVSWQQICKRCFIQTGLKNETMNIFFSLSKHVVFHSMYLYYLMRKSRHFYNCMCFELVVELYVCHTVLHRCVDGIANQNLSVPF